MRTAIFAYMDAGGEGIDPPVREALTDLQAEAGRRASRASARNRAFRGPKEIFHAVFGASNFLATGRGDRNRLRTCPLLCPGTVKGLVIFAAASLKDALDTVNAAWVKNGGKQAVISYAASSTLAKQIEEGAPADIFISADEDWMNYLADKKLIDDSTRIDLLGNDLVLIAPKDSTATTEIAPSFDLEKLLGNGKLAMANTDSVPAGKYGKAALTTSSASGTA